MRYWLTSPYLGFGPGAHSYFEGVRFETPRYTAAYLAAVAAEDASFLESDPHRIAGKEAQDEYVMLRMRLFEGIGKADFQARFGTSFEKVYGDTARLEAAGLLVRREGRIAFTERGMYVSNAILSEWLDFGIE
jgi:oxygen-independent coproporphyrinogen-3 oxidase